jgi:hypothetical protein
MFREYQHSVVREYHDPGEGFPHRSAYAPQNDREKPDDSIYISGCDHHFSTVIATSVLAQAVIPTSNQPPGAYALYDSNADLEWNFRRLSDEKVAGQRRWHRHHPPAIEDRRPLFPASIAYGPVRNRPAAADLEIPWTRARRNMARYCVVGVEHGIGLWDSAKRCQLATRRS